MKLKKLLKNITIKDIRGSKDIDITGICSNSKRVSPGNLFIAKKGKTSDGALFIPEAVGAGAAAVLNDIFDPFLENVTQLIDSDIDRLEVQLAKEFYQHPGQPLCIIGITGTSGKTTTAYLVKHMLDSGCGLIGTIECIIGDISYRATHTTPDLCTNYKMLYEMSQHECHSAVMEVTSHALDQGRVEGIDFDIGIFTNLSHEHLDYHPDYNHYKLSKQKLFSSLNRDTLAIVNQDDPEHKTMISFCKARIMTYGLNAGADLRYEDGFIFYKNEKAACKLPFIGKYNTYNCLAAIGVALARGQSLDQAAKKISTAAPVPGRLEPVPNDLGLEIYVDFAHKEDALDKVLATLKEATGKNIITVFGCGGDRDKTKRPRMAAAAERYSSHVIVTSDNPRTEDPLTICDEIVCGFTRDAYSIEPDRRQAIRKAIQMAKKNTVVLIAGKGHETYQIFRQKTIEFDDRKIANEICKEIIPQVI